MYCVGCLLGNGANVNAGNNEGKTPLSWASEQNQRGAVDLLRSEGGEE